MKRHHRKRIRLSQRTSLRKIIVTVSAGALIAAGTVAIYQFKQTDTAKASSFENSYSLDWSNPDTYFVSGGTVNSTQWNVKGQSCKYSSPVMNAGGMPEQPPKIAEIKLHINNGGNLEYSDTCQVNFLVNGEIAQSFVINGDALNRVFSLSHNLTVPAGGNYQVTIVMKNDQPDESWFLKNGDVSLSLKTSGSQGTLLTNFNAVKNKKGFIDVRWMTYTEVNNSYFTLERSANGIDFSPITRINGTGNSKALLKYEFNDMDPLPKKNYYRLLQVDLNGASSYSNVVSATVNGSIKDIRITRVYPNPFTDRFTVDFTSPSEQQFTLMLLSVDGKIVYEQLVTAFKGNNTVLLQPAESLEKGTYTMPLVFGNEVVGASRVSHM